MEERKPKKNFIYEDRVEEEEKAKVVSALQVWERKIDVIERQLAGSRSEVFYLSNLGKGGGSEQLSVLPVLAGTYSPQDLMHKVESTLPSTASEYLACRSDTPHTHLVSPQPLASFRVYRRGHLRSGLLRYSHSSGVAQILRHLLLRPRQCPRSGNFHPHPRISSA